MLSPVSFSHPPCMEDDDFSFFRLLSPFFFAVVVVRGFLLVAEEKL